MQETQKSSLRRSRDPAYQTYLSGNGIDIGAGDDGLGLYQALFPGVTQVRHWDVADGDAQEMADVAEHQYDFIHSSHCLEHLEDPVKALGHWLRICKPGGYVIVTVPDEDLYEGGHWPSKLNPDHKVSFTIHKTPKALPASINVVDLIASCAHLASCERVILVRENYDEQLRGVDQTANGNAECAIEFVLRKNLGPGLADLLFLAQQHEKMHDRDAAHLLYQKALRLYPYEFAVYHRYAMLSNDLGQYEATNLLWAHCAQALPNLHAAHLYQALHMIAMGQLQAGFTLRDRLVSDARRTPIIPPTAYPRWQGQSLEGKSIVIWTEFGYGDEIFFLRFASILKEQGATTVSVVCQESLVHLFAKASGFTVYSATEAPAVPKHDYWVFPHSIMVYLPLEFNALPRVDPYLVLPMDDGKPLLPDLCLIPRNLENKNLEKSERKTGKKSAMRVALCFAGSPTHENDQARSLPSLDYLEPLFEMKDIAFYSVQLGPRSAELEQFTKRYSNIMNLAPHITDYLDTAQYLEQVDLVITVDTSVAHLAGAMGIPVWILLPTVSDWRWHLGADKSCWYQSAKLYRQEWVGEWAQVIMRVQQDLQCLATNHASGDGSHCLLMD